MFFYDFYASTATSFSHTYPVVDVHDAAQCFFVIISFYDAIRFQCIFLTMRMSEEVRNESIHRYE